MEVATLWISHDCTRAGHCASACERGFANRRARVLMTASAMVWRVGKSYCDAASRDAVADELDRWACDLQSRAPCSVLGFWGWRSRAFRWQVIEEARQALRSRGRPPSDSRRHPTARVGPAVIVLVAAWIGLLAGFLDLGLMIFRTRASGQGFYRLSDQFPWIIPAAVCGLVLLPGTVLAFLDWLRRGTVRLGWAVGLLSFVGFVNACSRLPIEAWASLLLSSGLAVRCGSLAGARREPFLRLVRRTAPALVGVLLAITVISLGRRAWSEHRALATLPPPPAGARNVLLIVWDTVRAGNLSLHGYGRQTSPNLERLAAGGVRFDRAFCDRPMDPAVARQPVYREVAPRADGGLAGAARREPTPRSPSTCVDAAMIRPGLSPTSITAAGKPA